MRKFMLGLTLLLSQVSYAGVSCTDVFYQGENYSKEFWQLFDRLEIPPRVTEFLDSNKAYTEYLKGFKTRDEAYFIGRVFKDWIQIRDYLPKKDHLSVLDIGSGIGGIDLMIARHMEKTKGSSNLTLVDKVEKAGFNVLELAESVLFNNVRASEIKTFDIGSPEIANAKYDVVLSLRGLAYLFPYEVYRSEILSTLKMDGLLVLDISVRQSETSDVVTERFGGEASGKRYDAVMADIRATIGEPKVITKNHSYHRIVVRRTVEQ